MLLFAPFLEVNLESKKWLPLFSVAAFCYISVWMYFVGSITFFMAVRFISPVRNRKGHSVATAPANHREDAHFAAPQN